MKFSTRQRRAPPDINLTGLVDIIFNLLLFFLLTTSFSESAGISVELPQASSGARQTRDDRLVVVVDAEGRAFVGGESVDRERLETMMEALRDRGDGGAVMLQADSAAAHGDVVELIDLAKKVGMKHVGIATRGVQ